MSQDGGGLSFDPACELEGGLQLCKIVTIDRQDLCTEIPEFCVDRIWRIDLLQRSIALDMIVVQDDDQIIKLLISGKLQCLPDLSFLNLAVTEQGVDAVVLPAHFTGECHPDRHGQALSKRSRAHIYARCVLFIGMPLQIGIDLPEASQICFRKVSTLSQHRVIDRRCVSLGQNKAIAQLPIGALRVDVHLRKIQIRQNLDRRKAAAQMTRACMVHHIQDLFADDSCCLLQCFYFHKSPYS